MGKTTVPKTVRSELPVGKSEKITIKDEATGVDMGYTTKRVITVLFSLFADPFMVEKAGRSFGVKRFSF